MIKMIWCSDVNNGVGIGNQLPWNVKEEMAHFINETKGQIVVMGENTFKSIGKPLPNRKNIVLSDDSSFNHEGITIYNDYKKILSDFNDETIYIIGGISIYKLFYEYADVLIISKLNKSYNCDRFLAFDLINFDITKTIKHNEFVVNYYERRKNV